MLLRASSEPRLRGSGLGFWLVEPYASWTSTDPAAAMNHFTACNKQAPGNLWMCFANSDAPDKITPEQAFEFVRPQMREHGFGEIEHVSERLSNWPVYARAGTDFFDRVKQVQGKNNIFLGGEIMSGPTLELIIDYVGKARRAEPRRSREGGPDEDALGGSSGAPQSAYGLHAAEPHRQPAARQ